MNDSARDVTFSIPYEVAVARSLGQTSRAARVAARQRIAAAFKRDIANLTDAVTNRHSGPRSRASMGGTRSLPADS